MSWFLFLLSFVSSMLRLEHDADQLSLTEKSDVSSSPPNTTARSAPVTPTHNRSSSVDVGYRDGTQRGFFDGLLGCLRPVWTIIGKAAAAELKQQGVWNEFSRFENKNTLVQFRWKNKYRFAFFLNFFSRRDKGDMVCDRMFSLLKTKAINVKCYYKHDKALSPVPITDTYN